MSEEVLSLGARFSGLAQRRTYEVSPTPAPKTGSPVWQQCGLNTSGNTTSLLRSVSTPADFPAWMDLPAATLTNGWGHRCQGAQTDQKG